MPYLDYGVSIPEIGGEANTWGTKFNDKTFPMLLRLMRGYRSVDVSGNTSIVYTNGDLAANGSAGYILLSDSALAGVPIITFPGVENLCFLKNGSSTYAMTLTAGGNTVSLAAGRTVLFICDGTTVAIWDPTAESAGSAATAAASATTAASSAGTATTQKDLATAQKTYAQEWAQNPEDDPVSVAAGGDNVTTFSALHWAAKAEDQAIIASAQAALAAGYASSIDPSTLQPKDAALTSLSGLSLVAGDLLYATGADTLARLAKGTSRQGLFMNVGATAPEWVDASPGGLVLLSAQTISSAVAALDFTTGIDSTYDEYEIHLQNILNAVDNSTFGMRTSADGGANYALTAGDYRGQVTQATTSTISAAASATNYIQMTPAGGVGTATGETGVSGVIRLIRPANANYFYALFDLVSVNASTVVIKISGAGQRTASAIVNAVRFFSPEGNIASGLAKLYGVKKS